jgi:hypothetical protein
MIPSALPTLVRLGIAVYILFSGVGNAWLRGGLFVFLAASAAFRVVFSYRDRVSPVAMLRVCAAGWLIAGVLATVGSLTWGGGVGWLGAGVSTGITLIGAWSLTKFTRLDSGNPPIG